MNGKRIWAGTISLFVTMAVIWPQMAAAQQYPSGYEELPSAQPGDPRAFDGFQAWAGAEAADRGHAERLAAIRLQLGMIELMKCRAGLPPGPEGGFFFSSTSGFPGDPWQPFLVGGIRFARIARQSIGQRQIQTGPNRWESHPVYAGSSLIEPPTFQPDVPVTPAPITNGSGPREF